MLGVSIDLYNVLFILVDFLNSVRATTPTRNQLSEHWSNVIIIIIGIIIIIMIGIASRAVRFALRVWISARCLLASAYIHNIVPLNARYFLFNNWYQIHLTRVVTIQVSYFQINKLLIHRLNCAMRVE